MIGKLRPVGSHVPQPVAGSDPLPWDMFYHAEYCASGTDALAIAVGVAASRKPEIRQPEVIIPGYGCPDLVSAIVSEGAIPVVIDVLESTPFLNDKLVREAISGATVAVVAVGFLGLPERLEVLSGVCEQNDLVLIEDSAQCFPPASCSTPLADFVVLSFGRGKPINLMGGGALLCSHRCSEEWSGIVGRYPENKVGTAFIWRIKRHVFNLCLNRLIYSLMEKITILGIGQTKLQDHLETSRRQIPLGRVYGGIQEYWRRPLVHQWYDLNLKFLETSGWILLNQKRFGLPESQASSPKLRYGILAPSAGIRDQALEALNGAGIGANAFYGKALHSIEGVGPKIIGKSFPVADDFASRLITLPCHEDVAETDLRDIVDVLNQLSNK